ncbi:hypothetical protein [Croceivirga thetidis]|uniref:Uncharacterized protein n=1 Tax=Croceivirga thetidis TaxID=2721623 RepID=A0ABX1GMM1_9FLAO|nr:hypothetical protein [Croceivirga thetidis]NKI30869.1 hypothetical protein [Croceivirga thetidis]
MHNKTLHIILFLAALPLMVKAQEQNVTSASQFYHELGIKDAKYELSLESLNSEDEKDFWIDQIAFENGLKKLNPNGYQLYVDGKSQVYRQHKIHCGDRCNHSEEFAKYISYYVVNGKLGLTETAVYAAESKKTKKKE